MFVNTHIYHNYFLSKPKKSTKTTPCHTETVNICHISSRVYQITNKTSNICQINSCIFSVTMIAFEDIFNIKNWIIFLLAYMSILFLLFCVSCIRGKKT